MQIWLTHLLPKENLQVEIFSNQYIINEWRWVSYEELWRSRRVLSVSGHNTLLDLHNSSYDMKAEFNNWVF